MRNAENGKHEMAQGRKNRMAQGLGRRAEKMVEAAEKRTAEPKNNEPQNVEG